MVHRREINGDAIALGNHGALWGNAMTWWDHDTGSVWSQPLGEAILGPRTGETLELLPSTLTRWSEWQELHPDTLALDAASSPRGFALDQMSIVVELAGESASFPVPLIQETGIINTALAGVPVAVVIEPGTERWAVFSRQVNNGVVRLGFDDGELYDLDGRGVGLGQSDRWNAARGLALDRSNESLVLLPAFTSFQFDYWTFFPDGQVWDGTQLVADDR